MKPSSRSPPRAAASRRIEKPNKGSQQTLRTGRDKSGERRVQSVFAARFEPSFFIRRSFRHLSPDPRVSASNQQGTSEIKSDMYVQYVASPEHESLVQ